MIRPALARLAAMTCGVLALTLTTTIPGPERPAETVTSDEWGEVPDLPSDAYLPPDLCHPVDVSETSGITWQALDYLTATGWKGDAGDKREALYPPTCVHITAEDGTVTVNHIHDDGTVTGTVTMPNGETETW